MEKIVNFLLFPAWRLHFPIDVNTPSGSIEFWYPKALSTYNSYKFCLAKVETSIFDNLKRFS